MNLLLIVYWVAAYSADGSLTKYINFLLLQYLYLLYSHTHTKAPLWVFEGVGSRQISSEVVSQQCHFLQSHLLPPLLQGCHKLLLCPLWVSCELGSAASAKAQKV